jgi:uncharacterized membrane protein YphA (DoxX/SURF4 family)
MPDNRSETPKFVWIILLCLGALDLVRGFMHTVLIKYAAANIAGLNLNCAADDQMFLLGVFGISNYVTGAIFIAIPVKARQIAALTLGLNLAGYSILRSNMTPQAPFQGGPMMMVYLTICVIIVAARLVITRMKKKAN